MTTRTSTSPCWRACSTAAVEAMKPSATQSCCRPARFLDGRPTWSCHPIRSGSATTQAVCGDWSETGSIRRWRACSCTRPARSSRTPTVWIEPGARRRHFSTGGSRHSPKPMADSVSMSRSRFRSMARANWKSTCCALIARVAVELDGAQHLADPVAYRRDRRKDQLLQENDYFVLRFLAEDVGKDLDLVLDAVLRALSRRAAPSAIASPLRVFRSLP